MPQARHGDGGFATDPPCLTMREQIITRISLRDDVPLRWPSCEDYSARWPMPSKQRVAGSNPAGRASLRSSRFGEDHFHVGVWNFGRDGGPARAGLVPG